jgi:uncharacterized damage-inducible protein DinB
VDLLDRLLGHDAWTTRALLGRAATLDDAALDRPFELGHRTVRATLLHLVRNMEVWADLMAGVPVRAVAGRDGWDETWLDVLDDPPARKTYGGALAHVITHSMHHRAQVIAMLRALGVGDVPEGDVLSWEARNRP